MCSGSSPYSADCQAVCDDSCSDSSIGCTHTQAECGSGISPDDERKLNFIINARKIGPKGDEVPNLSTQNMNAIDWVAQRTADQRHNAREIAIQAIETHAEKFRITWDSWMSVADDKIKCVSRDSNGPLMEALSNIGGYDEPDFVNLFRLGGHILGNQVHHGIGAHREPKKAAGDIEKKLHARARQRNRRTLKRLRDDPFAVPLLEKTTKDILKGLIKSFDLTENGHVGLSTCVT